MNNIIIRGFILIVLVFILNSFLYFSFGNIYSAHLFNYQTFEKQFSSGVYQYRFLSTDILKWIYNELNSYFPNGVPIKATFLDKNANVNLFFAFYLINTIFLILTTLMMNILTSSKYFLASSLEKFLIVILGLIPILISQFVMVPYDCSSYFLLLVFFYLMIKYIHKPTDGILFLLIVILIISTFNRESSALSLSLAATLLVSKYEFSKKSFIPIVIFTCVFVAVYFILRYIFGGFTTNDGSLLEANFSNPNALLGLAFGFIFFLISLLISKGSSQIKLIILFHIFALPYTIMCFYSGYLYEIRLYVPIFLTSLFLSRLTLEEEFY